LIPLALHEVPLKKGVPLVLLHGLEALEKRRRHLNLRLFHKGVLCQERDQLVLLLLELFHQLLHQSLVEEARSPPLELNSVD